MKNNEKEFGVYIELPELDFFEQKEDVTDFEIDVQTYEPIEDADDYSDEYKHFENDNGYEDDHGHIYDATFAEDDLPVQKRTYTLDDFIVDDDEGDNK